ncbi:MAG: hypothetical protein U9O85_06535 [Euryarchaeota archaeon]|nr:hypothetical protein [Euryarchaeota archaeon]
MKDKRDARKSSGTIFFAAIMITSIFAVVPIAIVGAQESNAAPEVICVPVGPFPTVPHVTWAENEVILKGTAHDPDGDADLATYEWDFGMERM